MSTLRIDDGESACIGMGANLGDARATLKAAQHALAALPGTTLTAVSPIYRSAPIDAPAKFEQVAHATEQTCPDDAAARRAWSC